MSAEPCELIRETIGEIFTCAQVNEYTRIRTPFLYPDGDVIDVFLKNKGGVLTLTDLGESLRWLKMQSLSPRRSPRRQKLIQDVCLTHGLEFFHGMLVLRVAAGESLASATTRIAQGALRVADVWFTMRTRSVESVNDEVEDLLKEKSIPFERGEELIGRSGKAWRIDFHTRTPRRSSLVSVLSTGSRSASKAIAEHVLATWYDLSNLKVGPEALQFISLFDDTADVWSSSDIHLLAELSEIARWSKPEEFVTNLAP
jgi:hypothetical protein